MILCDIHDNKSHALVSVAPRSVLRRQIAAANSMGYPTIYSATELEYYQYETTYRDAFAKGYVQKLLKPSGDYMEDYHILQTSREEKYTATFRKHLKASGIPTENSKGECGIGQHELNVRYADILPMADRHIVYKQCLKEVADQIGMSVTFMAKPFTDATGSGCHVHMSIFDAKGKNAFVGDEQLGPVKCSKLFKQFLAGWFVQQHKHCNAHIRTRNLTHAQRHASSQFGSFFVLLSLFIFLCVLLSFLLRVSSSSMRVV